MKKKDTTGDGQQDMFSDEEAQSAPRLFKPLTSMQQRLIEPIPDEQPDEINYLHPVLCHLGFPRRDPKTRVFERRSGRYEVRLEAGSAYNGKQWVELPLPYGTRPRLAMIHLSSEAIRTQSPIIEVGSSLRGFLRQLKIDQSGGRKGGLTEFKRQMQALAVCQLRIAMPEGDRIRQLNTQPIEGFEAWTQTEDLQLSMWPAVIQLSQRYFETLIDHPVPFHPAHIYKLQDSALALDIYTWLAHRLYQVNTPRGVIIRWNKLKEQFGQEYKETKDFKREFVRTLSDVRLAYQDANVAIIEGGMLLKPSRPPIEPKTSILVNLPYTPHPAAHVKFNTAPPSPKKPTPKAP